MSCCYDKIFGSRQARRDARAYRRKGAGPVSRRMIDFAHGSRTVLDVGGGVGVLALELLRAGSEHATVVELSRGYDAAASELRAEAGIPPERLDRRVVDILSHPDLVPAADAVLLNRVVCCHPDVDALVGAAAERARSRLVLSFPRDRWWIRAAAAAINATMRAFRSEFRFFVHAPRRIAAAAEAHGLRQSLEGGSRIWQVAGFERTVSG
jgi:magnesium-protoporphyrin O-methyltransferase